VSRRTARLLERSPRFRISDRAPFTLRVERARACLQGATGAQLLCTALPAAAADEEASARLKADEVQHRLLLARVDLSQSDLQSLDGSPAAERIDRQLREVLGELRPLSDADRARLNREREADEAAAAGRKNP
jgi:hypothetical protein